MFLIESEFGSFVFMEVGKPENLKKNPNRPRMMGANDKLNPLGRVRDLNLRHTC